MESICTTDSLSGSFNQTVCLKDGRKPSHSGFKFPVSAEVESLAWDPHSEHSFMVSLENGTVTSFDIRAASADLTSETKPSFTIHAHDKAVSSMSFNPLVPDGAVFSVSFSNACPFLLAIGGSKGKLHIAWTKDRGRPGSVWWNQDSKSSSPMAFIECCVCVFGHNLTQIHMHRLPVCFNIVMTHFRDSNIVRVSPPILCNVILS